MSTDARDLIQRRPLLALNMQSSAPRTLVIDIGGTNVKVWGPRGNLLEKIPSGPNLTAQQMVEQVSHLTAPSTFDRVSLGFPGKVEWGRPVREPFNLGGGWVDFDYAAALDKPTRLMNDAAMQALGGYEGGRMLFLGLGTSVGSTLIAENMVIPLELGNIPHAFGESLEDYLAKESLKEKGKGTWRDAVLDAVPRLKNAFMADYVVLGGGNADKLRRRLPPAVRIGTNRHACGGGRRLWECRASRGIHIFEGQLTRSVFAADAG
jgi:polyphosphate glucokinase